MAKLAFIGLGVMGYPMAGHLSQAGHDVVVYNRTVSKAVQWCNDYSGNMAYTPAEAAAHAEFVFSCVGNDDDVRAVLTGEQGVIQTKTGGVVVDHTTASAGLAKELKAAFAQKGVGFIDAPISGGQAGAENGLLTVMAGGDKAHFEKIEAIIAAYSRQARLLGAAGSGQLAKMMNQICVAGLLQGLAEALQFGQKAGLDCNAVLDVISQGAAQSWQMDNRGKTMLANEYDFGFAVDWMRKDLGIALNEARNNGSLLPLTALVDQFYAEVQNMGGGRWDTSSLLKRLV